MKRRLTINTKLLIYIITTATIIYSFSIGYISYNSKQIALEDAYRYTDKVAQLNATEIESDFNADLSVVRTLSYAFKTYKNMSNDEWKKLFGDMYIHIFEKNPEFYALWDSWEFNYIDPTWDKPTGRYIKTVWREEGATKEISYAKSLDGDPEVYAAAKAENLEALWEPYFDVFDEGKKEKKFMTSLISPLQENGEFMGLVGIDITIDKVQELVNQIKPFENSYAFLLSYQGVFASYPDVEIVGQPIGEFWPEISQQNDVLNKIQKGKNFSFFYVDEETDETYYYSFANIQVGKTSTPWSLGIAVPQKVIMTVANKNFKVSILIGIIGLLIIFIVVWLIARNISSPLVKTTNILKELANGKINNKEKLLVKSNDEIKDMADSVNTLIEGLDRTAEFAREIGKGNLNAEFDILSDDDVLGNSLLEMRKSLKHAEEEENNRKIEDEKQNWITQGLAKFGDILRQNNDNLEELAFNVMSNLINYVNANQGAVYILNNSNKDDLHYEMKGAVAFDRSKLIEKKILIGEGLVGRCAFEKLTIYMIDVPKDYVKITSGLGEATPRCVLLVPLILNDDVYGVIELISFNEFEKHQINFIETLGQNIASTISTVKINETTAMLLEESQKQQEELSSQEEEMRQNLEEMQATQEEAAKREAELQSILNAMNAISLVAEYDMDGRLIEINEKFTELLGISRDQLIGKPQGSLGKSDSESDIDVIGFWNDLRNGIAKEIIQKVELEDRTIWLREEYSPILDNEGEPMRVLNIAIDITDTKLRENGQ
jgi:PAS domain S-box-containing protein